MIIINYYTKLSETVSNVMHINYYKQKKTRENVLNLKWNLAEETDKWT